MINNAGLGELSVQPARTPANAAGLRPIYENGRRREKWLNATANYRREDNGHKSTIIDQDGNQATSKLHNDFTLKIGGKSFYPLLAEVALNKSEQVGTVHVFDVSQVNGDGTKGGLRLATIGIPEASMD